MILMQWLFVQVCVRGLQLVVVASARLQHSRPPLLPARAHADSHATLPYDLGTGLTSGLALVAQYHPSAWWNCLCTLATFLLRQLASFKLKVQTERKCSLDGFFYQFVNNFINIYVAIKREGYYVMYIYESCI